MKTISEVEFEKIVQTIHDKINYSFDESGSKVYGILLDENNNPTIEQVHSGVDVYQLLEELMETPEALKDYDIFTLGTLGWAAPIGDGNEPEMAPSQHPERRRVRVLSNTSSTGMIGSSIMFQDDVSEPVFDYGKASGALNDAIMSLFRAVHKN